MRASSFLKELTFDDDDDFLKSERNKLSISFFKWSETLLIAKQWVLQYRELLKKSKSTPYLRTNNFGS